MRIRTAFVIIASSTSMLLGALFNTQTVFAADETIEPYIPNSVIQGQAKASLDKMLNMCYENMGAPYGAFNNSGNPTAKQITSQDWFRTGYLLAGNDGEAIAKRYALNWANDTAWWCDSFNAPNTTGAGVSILNNTAKSLFGWSDNWIETACRIGLARSDGSDCVNSKTNADFKRVGYKSQASDVSPQFNTDQAKYVRDYLLCGINKTPSFIKADTASSNTKTMGYSIEWIVVVADNKASVVQAYGAGGSCSLTQAKANEYAKWLNLKSQDDVLKEGNGSIKPPPTDPTSVCAGGSLGWVLCPVLALLESVNGALAGEIENQLLVGPLTDDSDYTKGIRPIWNVIVGFANLALVIAFLIVIFSQATSMGLSAYGIKKMLPRIIAAAILINLSFFICAIALDIANVLGNSVKGIIELGMNNITTKTTNSITWDAIAIDLGAAGLGIGAAAVTGVIGFLVPLGIAIITGLLILFLGLAIRKVLIVLLIIIAPLAFAAMVLPGTEALFKKWGKSYLQLLIMYPIIVAILYGSALVAKIILAAGGM